MKRIVILADADTAKEILAALTEAEEFGQITGDFDVRVNDLVE